MTAYPEPPSPSDYPLEGQSRAFEEVVSDDVRPELPSKSWPWLVGIAAVAALSLQTWSLLALLQAGKNESDFQAKVVAWESANESRQEAIDTWDSIEKQASKNVDQLREQSALLQGTIDSLQNQRDQLVESTTSQTKTLASLQSDLQAAETELASANQKMQEAELAAMAADASKTEAERSNTQLIERGKKIKAALAILESESAKAEAKAETLEELLVRSQAELEAVQARTNQVDMFLQQRLKSAAEYRLQQERSAEAAKELETATKELQKLTAAAAKAKADLELLEKQLANQRLTRDKSKLEFDSIQADVETAEAKLAELRKKEQQLVDQVSAMTTKLNAAATAATKSLSDISDTAASTIQEMATKAAEIRKAVSEIEIPASPSAESDDES